VGANEDGLPKILYHERTNDDTSFNIGVSYDGINFGLRLACIIAESPIIESFSHPILYL